MQAGRRRCRPHPLALASVLWFTQGAEVLQESLVKTLRRAASSRGRAFVRYADSDPGGRVFSFLLEEYGLFRTRRSAFA
jgi:hypothetical protein